LEADQAKPSNIAARGAGNHTVMESESISREDVFSATDTLKPKRKKKARRLNLDGKRSVQSQAREVGMQRGSRLAGLNSALKMLSTLLFAFPNQDTDLTKRFAKDLPSPAFSKS
jgi:hypothetical protein